MNDNPTIGSVHARCPWLPPARLPANKRCLITTLVKVLPD